MVGGNGAEAATADVASALAVNGEHLANIKEQDARYSVSIEALGAVQCVRFVMANKHVDEVRPQSLYVPFPVILRMAGQLLASIELGSPDGGVK